MIQITHSEYAIQYYILRNLESYEDFTIYLGRNKKTRQDFHIWKLGNLTEAEVKDAMDHYFKNYSEKYNVKLHCFVIHETEDKRYEQILMYEVTQVLDEYLQKRTGGLSNNLTLKESLYFFHTIASFLNHTKENYEYYGCLRSSHIRIDNRRHVKFFLVPCMKTSLHLAHVRISKKQSINVEKNTMDNDFDLLHDDNRDFMFSPEQLDWLKTGFHDFDNINFKDWEKIDIYNQGLWTLYYINRKPLTKSINFDRLNIDHMSIYHCIKNISIMYDKQFADILRNCLMVDPKDRLSTDELLRLISRKYDIEFGINDDLSAKFMACDRLENKFFEQNLEGEDLAQQKLELGQLTLNKQEDDVISDKKSHNYRSKEKMPRSGSKESILRSGSRGNILHETNKLLSYGKLSRSNQFNSIGQNSDRYESNQKNSQYDSRRRGTTNLARESSLEEYDSRRMNGRSSSVKRLNLFSGKDNQAIYFSRDNRRSKSNLGMNASSSNMYGSLSRNDVINESIVEESPFRPGANKTYKLNTENFSLQKKQMLHDIEKNIMPSLPYHSMTDITVDKKHFIFREYKPKLYIGNIFLKAPY